tara:strand:- start:815 stop:1012 length:198 start_codon:yes stop_codon:yes gene_type:complete
MTWEDIITKQSRPREALKQVLRGVEINTLDELISKLSEDNAKEVRRMIDGYVKEYSQKNPKNKGE